MNSHELYPAEIGKDEKVPSLDRVQVIGQGGWLISHYSTLMADMWNSILLMQRRLLQLWDLTKKHIVELFKLICFHSHPLLSFTTMSWVVVPELFINLLIKICWTLSFQRRFLRNQKRRGFTNQQPEYASCESSVIYLWVELEHNIWLNTTKYAPPNYCML